MAHNSGAAVIFKSILFFLGHDSLECLFRPCSCSSFVKTDPYLKLLTKLRCVLIATSAALAALLMMLREAHAMQMRQRRYVRHAWKIYFIMAITTAPTLVATYLLLTGHFRLGGFPFSSLSSPAMWTPTMMTDSMVELSAGGAGYSKFLDSLPNVRKIFPSQLDPNEQPYVVYVVPSGDATSLTMPNNGHTVIVALVVFAVVLTFVNPSIAIQVLDNFMSLVDDNVFIQASRFMGRLATGIQDLRVGLSTFEDDWHVGSKTKAGVDPPGLFRRTFTTGITESDIDTTEEFSSTTTTSSIMTQSLKQSLEEQDWPKPLHINVRKSESKPGVQDRTHRIATTRPSERRSRKLREVSNILKSPAGTSDSWKSPSPRVFTDNTRVPTSGRKGWRSMQESGDLEETSTPRRVDRKSKFKRGRKGRRSKLISKLFKKHK